MLRYLFALVFIALMASCSKERQVLIVSVGEYKIEGRDVKPHKSSYNAPYNKHEYNWFEGEMKIAGKDFKMEDEGTYIINNTDKDLIISSLDAPKQAAKDALAAVASATSIDRAFQEIELNNTGQEDVLLIDRIPPHTMKKITKNKNTRVFGPQSNPPRNLDLKGGEKPLLFQMFDVEEVRANFKKALPQ